MDKEESLRGNYKFVSDEEELKWFFDHVLIDLSKEKTRKSYLMCIATRPKKLDKEERELFGISGSDGVMMREEIASPRGKDHIWSYDEFVGHIFKYECPKRGMITKNGFGYPDKSLAVLIYAEPSDEVKVSNSLIRYANEIIAQTVEACERTINFGSIDGIKGQLDKFSGIAKKSKSIYAESTDSVFVHFDFDIADDMRNARGDFENGLKAQLSTVYGKGNYFIIKTNGGYHVLVKKSCLSVASQVCLKSFGNKDPIHTFAKNIDDTLGIFLTKGEKRLQGQCFVPVPGTIMYGKFVPTIINKEDFEE
jgi:hypothetical protein